MLERFQRTEDDVRRGQASLDALLATGAVLVVPLFTITVVLVLALATGRGLVAWIAVGMAAAVAVAGAP